MPVADVAARAAAARSRSFRLTLLHNNDGESKYIVGDSIANYGGITRFKTVLDRLRAEADAYTNADAAGTEDKGTVTISSGDNFLAGLNLRASFQRFDAGDGPVLRLARRSTRIGYDAVTIGNHEYDFGPARLAQFIAVPSSGVPFLTANTDFSGEPTLQALRNTGPDRRLGRRREGRPEDRHHRRLPAGDPDDLLAARREVQRPTSPAIVNAEAAAPDRRGREQDHPVLAPAEHRTTRRRSSRSSRTSTSSSPAAPTSCWPTRATVLDRRRPPARPVGPYPTVAKDARRRDVPIVTTQGEYRYVGRLTVTFDAAGKLDPTDAREVRPGPRHRRPGAAGLRGRGRRR